MPVHAIAEIEFKSLREPLFSWDSLDCFETEVILGRHGETNLNAAGTFQGEQISNLSDKGWIQAFELADRLSKEKISAICCSSMPRAKQTAFAIATRLYHKTAYVFPRLREFKIGVLEGKKNTVYKERLKEQIAAGNYTTLEQKRSLQIAKGADTIQEVLDRVIPTLKEMALYFQNQKVVAVTHAWVMQCLVSLFKEVDKDDVEVKNTAMLYLRAKYVKGEEKITLTLERTEEINIQKGRLFLEPALKKV